jgi:hypothetical protein
MLDLKCVLVKETLSSDPYKWVIENVMKKEAYLGFFLGKF